jgi:phospholipid transport system transporter-binding protein
MIRVVGQRLEISGDVNMDNASTLLAEGTSALDQAGKAGAGIDIDLGGLTTMDSSLLAVIFAWMRTAKANGYSLRLLNLPANLLSLATVYGVADLLPPH